ncbi:hypothetical protein [Nesterenkonia rhizosphaerae]|uniref:Uncharacterized protein n=1 Tax=Nesterenkonia rhizosphaerae TaxID=1348272 RepID=A0ABP9FZX3_9MICC
MRPKLVEVLFPTAGILLWADAPWLAAALAGLAMVLALAELGRIQEKDDKEHLENEHRKLLGN